MDCRAYKDAIRYKDKRAAEQILRDEAMQKDFWAVTDYQDNSEMLQKLIDLIYNSVEGNDYVVDYQDNQNGTRLMVKCKVCNKELSSYDPFVGHENGKSHRKVRNRSLTSQDPLTLDSLELQPHNKPRGIFPEGSLEDQIDSTNYRVLGMQFVYKEVIDGRDMFTCQLCESIADVRQLPPSRMFSHLTSKGHNQTYLEVKFGFIKKSSKDFDDECLAIEEFEGKIHEKIVDLTRLCPTKPKAHTHLPSLSPPRKAKIPKLEPHEPQSEVGFEVPDRVKPETSDIGVNVDMSSEARFILNEINALQDVDSLLTLQNDDDMQVLLKETLWDLASKLEKYFHRTKETSHEGTPLYVAADKVKQYIADLAD